MAKFKDREAKEAPYIKHNKDVSSVCIGSFYIKGRNIHEPCKNREECQKYAKYKDKKEDTPEVGFYYVDSFRKCDLWKYKTIDGAYALQIAIYNMVYVNDLACACVIDMKDKVYTQDKETQKIYRALAKRQSKYERKICEILGDTEIYRLADFNSTMDDTIQPLMTNLFNSIYKYLNDNNIENSFFISRAECAYIILGYSIISIEKRIKECLKYNKDVINLRSYKMTEMRDIAKNLCDWVSRKCNGIDLNKSTEIMNSYKALDKALTNVNILSNAIIQTR